MSDSTDDRGNFLNADLVSARAAAEMVRASIPAPGDGIKVGRPLMSLGAAAAGKCSFGSDCAGGGGMCSFGSNCAGGGGKCSFGSNCAGGGGKCSFGSNCAGGGGKCSFGSNCGGS